MSNISYSLWLLISIGLFTGACSSGNSMQKLKGGSLENTTWNLTSMPAGLPKEVAIDLHFEQEKINGKAVCNRYFSSYVSDKHTISFKEIGATRMMCPEHSKLEITYLDLLSKAHTFGIDKDVLTIQTSEGDLVFHKAKKEKVLLKSDPFQGSFVTSGFPNDYFQSLEISRKNDCYQIVISGSKVKGKAACSFEGSGLLKNESLYVPIENDAKTVYMIIKPIDKGLEVKTEHFDDRFSLMYYCSGGTSLMGTYWPKNRSISNPKLHEKGLGTYKFGLTKEEIEEHLRQLFPHKSIQKKIGKREEGAYEYYAIGDQEDVQVHLHDGNRISSVYLKSPILADEHGVKVGMPFHVIQAHLPKLQLKTDHHFHTYAQVPSSHIKYEICCNTDQPDKENWTEEEIRDWKVKSIIWEAS